MFSSPEQLAGGLRSSGYIADPIAITTVFLASRLKKPLLLEGPAGSGKTQIAYAVAQAAGTYVERLQCYEGVNEEKAIGKFDEALQRLSIELKSKSVASDWHQIQGELRGQEFFSAGPLLRALQYEDPDGCPQTHRAEDSLGETDCEVRPLDDRTDTPGASRSAQRDSSSSAGPAFGMGG
jgi:ATPase family associated with various cellular activities (AAA)